MMQRDKLKQHDIKPIFLSLMSTIKYVLVPFLSLGSSTARLNPKLSTSPIARKINLVGQTKLIIRRDLQRYQIMHIRIQRRIKYCSQIILIINPQFIGSRQTHRKKSYIEQISKKIEENFVLRSKEREEAIQLITMDPKVCGKLLTHHRRGYGVDVEALRDRIPLRQIAGKGPYMGSHGYRRLQWWKSGFVAPLDVFRV